MKNILAPISSAVLARPLVWLLALICLGTRSGAQVPVLDPFYASQYSITQLGSAPGVPTNYGGLVFKAGDPNTLLIGGSANGGSGAIYEIAVARDPNGHVTGFNGTAALHASAPFIDGGLTYGPAGILFYATYNNNTLGQIKPGSVAPDKVLPLAPVGVAGSTGAIAFVPPGFPNAGHMKILSYSGNTWYDSQVVEDTTGTFDVVNVGPGLPIGGGPEGAVFIPPGNPQFANPSVLIASYGTGRILAYELDGNSDPILATARDFITNLSGAEGAVIDPVTGDFLFCTFGGGNQVIAVRGFAAPPPPLTPPIAVIGSGNGTPAQVRAFKPGEETPLRSFSPFPGYTGGVRVAVGDVNGDGVLDIIVATATSAGHVKVFDGTTGAEVRSFFAFGPSFTGGVNVAAGDVNGDGVLDIVASDASTSSHVKVFSGVDNSELRSFFAFPGFAGGVTVAAGDLNRDGRAEIFTGAATGSSHVKVFDGASGLESASFFAFGPAFSGGVSVAAGDLDGDGRADIITGASETATGTNGHVKAFRGSDQSELASFFAFQGFGGGVNVGAGDVNGDGRDDIIVAPSSGAAPHVKVFSGRTSGQLGSFFAFDPGFLGGVNVSGAGGGRALAAETLAATHITPTSARLNGLVIPHGGGTPTAMFEYGPDDTYGSSGAATLTPILDSDALAAQLVLPPGTLTPGATYHFRLVVNDGPETAEGGDHTFTTTINHPPIGGTFNVDPTTGVPLTTVFTATFAGWSDPDGPTTLQYEVRIGSIAIAPQGTSPSANFILPAGTHHVYGRIFGNDGEFTDTAPVVVEVEEAAPPTDPSFTQLYAKNGAVPGSGTDPRIQGNALWTGFGPPAINDGGHVAYLGRWKAPAVKTPVPLKVQSGAGIFVGDTLIVKVGEPVPGFPGTTFKILKDPVIDNGGHVAFLATIAGAGVISTNDTVVVSNGRTGTLEVLAREGSPAPGADGAVFKSFSSVSIKGVTTGGTIFTAMLLQGSGTPAALNTNDSGAWWLPAGQTETIKLIREGDPGFVGAETIKSFQVLKALGGSPGHGRGQRGGDGALIQVVTSTNRQSQVLARPNTLTEYTTTGDVLGGATLSNATWSKMNLPSSGNFGENISVLGVLTSNVAGVTGPTAKGIFASEDAGDTWNPLIRVGDTTTGIPSTTLGALKDPVNSGTGADLAFAGAVKGTGIVSTNNDCLWFRPASGPLVLLAREGDQPPGAPPGARWKTFSSLALPGNHAGPIFTAMLQKGVGATPGPGGITSLTDLGLYYYNVPAAAVRELIREGQPLLSKTVKTFNVLKAVSGSPGARRSYNDTGAIVVLVTFTDNTTAIVRIDLPGSGGGGGVVVL